MFFTHICNRCNHSWAGRKPDPKYCPRCNLIDWRTAGPTKKYNHKCNYCLNQWQGIRERPVYCPSCNRTGWDRYDVKPVSQYTINLASYRKAIKALQPGQSITLPWLSKDYPDQRMLLLVAGRDKIINYNTLCNPVKGLTVTRRLTPDPTIWDNYLRNSA